MTACKFKITPQSARATRSQRQPQNHRAHLKNQHGARSRLPVKKASSLSFPLQLLGCAVIFAQHKYGKSIN
jgi:hypothetical protein